MAAMNRSEMSDSNPGPELNLDDDSLFAELDGEVMAGDPPGGDVDFDLDLGGDTASTGDAGGDLDLDLGSDASAGGDLDLDLDLGGDESAGAATESDSIDLDDFDLDTGTGEAAEAAGGDELDLDLGGETAAVGDELDLDLGGETAAVGDELDLELGGESAAGGDELDLELGGESAAGGDELDLELGGESAAGGDELDLELGGDTATAADEIDFDLEGETAEPSAGEAGGGEDFDLGDLSTDDEMEAAVAEAEEPVADDMEALDLDLSDEGLDALDLGAVDEGLLDQEPETAEPAPEPAAAAEDTGVDELGVESLEIPEEPVFDMDAAPAAEGGEEFHAAEDIRLDEAPLSLELEDTGLEPEDEGEPFPEMRDTFDLEEEAPVALEPEMQAEPEMEFDTHTAAEAVAAEVAGEFVAVQDVPVDDDTLLELNLDDVEAGQMAEEDDSFMAQYAQPAPAMEETIPLTEQLEIPPESDQRAQARAAAPAARVEAAADTRMLNSEILMAVSHQIAVQLGSLSLNGKELLDIGYGSVLPLDRVIGEPVDLVLDNKTIAQGEVVLINGKNLGVRIVAVNKQ